MVQAVSTIYNKMGQVAVLDTSTTVTSAYISDPIYNTGFDALNIFARYAASPAATAVELRYSIIEIVPVLSTATPPVASTVRRFAGQLDTSNVPVNTHLGLHVILSSFARPVTAPTFYAPTTKGGAALEMVGPDNVTVSIGAQSAFKFVSVAGYIYIPETFRILIQNMSATVSATMFDLQIRAVK